MPNIAEVPTNELLISMEFTDEEKLEELALRVIPDSDELVEMRGGIRPTRPNL